MVSCQDKFNGTDNQSFLVSKKIIEQKLDSIEKIDLEKAMRVIALQAMKLKWDEAKKYDEKSINEISLDLVDGLTFSSVINKAEDFLKHKNKKRIKELTNEIDSLNIQKNEILAVQKILNLFKVSSIIINQKDFFDDLVPEVEVDYQYIGKNTLTGPKEIEYNILKKSTKEVLISQIITFGDDKSILENEETLTQNLILGQTKQTNPQLWNVKKYPIENPNLADYDLELEVNVLSLMLDGKLTSLPKVNIKELDAAIKEKNEIITELKTRKGTLDELELTDE
jgi:hypothetical protein